MGVDGEEVEAVEAEAAEDDLWAAAGGSPPPQAAGGQPRRQRVSKEVKPSEVQGTGVGRAIRNRQPPPIRHAPSPTPSPCFLLTP
eukprot:6383990-Pyramimonas_sp.AAC.1